MQGIILAAGMGKRLGKLTKNNTKCMVKVNGVTLIERMLRQLDKCNLKKIIIVVGYEGKKLIDYIGSLHITTEIVYVNNEIYDKTNNIYSLSLAKEYMLEDDTLLLESDIIFEDSVLFDLLQDKRDTLALVDKFESWMDGTCIKVGHNDSIDAFIPKSKFEFSDIENYYKTVNIYKFGKSFSAKYYVPFLNAYSMALGNNEYYEQVLKVITMLDDPVIKAKKLSGQLWYEIDDIQDLDIASSIFIEDEDKKVSMIQKRYGGYWRYPHMLDFCYLVNPFFPPQKMVDEIKASFQTLLTQYPSGLNVNCLLASKNFDVDIENIVVGNGAAELIKSLMANIEGKVGFIRPTFEEYPNRYEKEKVEFFPNNKDFSYNSKDIIDFFGDKNVSTILLINPDNPSGNYIPKQELITLIEWSKERKICLIIDESFVDFSDYDDSTLINQNIIDKYENLVIVKSISKSYGVPGLRLGVLVSSNREMIAQIKKDLSIWNINSFAEFYLQIEEKYKKDYTRAIAKFRDVRKKFKNKLEQIKVLRVIPSQANYFMIEVLGKYTSKELTKLLLVKYNLLIKDLTSKTNGKQFIRVAIRTEEENNKLVEALNEILK